MKGWEPPGGDDPVVQELLRFVAEHGLGARAEQLDLDPAFPRVEFQAMGRAGWLGLRIPSRLGGRGLSMTRAGLLLFHLARSTGATTFAKLSLQPEFSSVLAVHGAPQLVDRYFRPLVRGELLIGNHITEPGAGSDVRAISAAARIDSGGYVLDGEKSQAAFARDADLALVYARTTGPPAGISAFLVPQDLPGIERSVVDDLGERWMRRGTIRYREVRVPAEARIGEEGLGLEYLREELTRERALLAAIYLGVGWASWEETVRYAGKRRAFRRRLADQQAVAFPLVDAGVELRAIWLLVADILARLDREEPVDGLAAVAKARATEVALRCCDLGIQFHGGRGYSAELPHGRRWRDVRSGAIAHGSAEILRLVSAHELWPKDEPEGPPPARD